MTEMFSEKIFMQDAIEAYGKEAAMILCHTLISGLNDASAEVPLIKPITGYKLAITNKVPEDIGVRAFAGNDAIELLFSPLANIDRIAFMLTQIVYHEAGHIAHRQRNPGLSRSPDQRLFGGVIKEGIAIQAEYLPYGDDAQFVAIAERGDVRAEAALQALLDNPGINQPSRYYDYIIGDEAFPCRGYAIGHYVVESLRIQQNKSLIELMETPLSEFADFARTELV
jgi:uncharacterized protein YjaZ